MQRLWVIWILFLCGCSNLNDSRFSKNFYEEKRMQLTRKAEWIENQRTKLVAFSTFMSHLDFEAYPEGEVFLVEIVFEDSKLSFKDISFSLLGEKPIKIEKIKDEDKGVYRHSPWNVLYMVYFDSVSPSDVSKIVLEMKVKGEILKFDYSYVVENQI